MRERTEITGAQVRMARAFLRWSIAELATRANVGISSIQRIEATDGSPEVTDDLEWRAEARNRVIAAVRDTLIRAGVTFLPDDRHGVGIRGIAKKSPP
jgi:transcriptional regulator with XRE-family HTH domain